jgi:hypothetical protein
MANDATHPSVKPMATGAIDANGIWQYAEDDALASPTWSAYMNKGMASVSATISDTGWITTGLVFSSGWSISAAIGGWRSLAYRQIGKTVRLNGAVTKNAAWGAYEQLLTVPVSIRPTGAFVGQGDFVCDIQSTGGVRVRPPNAAGTTFGVDMAWVLG